LSQPPQYRATPEPRSPRSQSYLSSYTAAGKITSKHRYCNLFF
jgi:hypothetical protein